MTASTDNRTVPRWAEELKSASYWIERTGRTRGSHQGCPKQKDQNKRSEKEGLANVEALRREASGHDGERRKSLTNGLVNTVELNDCEFK